MQLNIKEAKENNITKVDSSINVDLSLFDNFIDKSFEELISDMVRSNKIINSFNPPSYIIDLIISCALSNTSTSVLKDELIDCGIPIISLILSVAIGYNQKYNYLKELDNAKEVFIFCNENNFIKALTLSKRFNSKVILSLQSVSLSYYKNVLEDFGIDNIMDLNVYVDYQKNNSPILIRDLYNISCIINSVVEEVNRYNLSPLEKVMFIYDKVKYRLYKDDKEDINSSRDLDKVLLGDKIVCSGYSNLFTATLNCLGISSIPTIDFDIKHQRSLAYIKDDKYNIDGVYAFDPTWDKRRNSDDNLYIDRYDYFLMPLVRSMESCYCEVCELLELDINKIIEIIDGEDIESATKMVDRLNILFSLVDSDYTPNNNYYNVDEVTRRYIGSINKYYSSEISFDNFIRLLYNTRNFEVTNGLIIDVNKDRIRDASIERYMKINRRVKKKK